MILTTLVKMNTYIDPERHQATRRRPQGPGYQQLVITVSVYHYSSATCPTRSLGSVGGPKPPTCCPMRPIPKPQCCHGGEHVSVIFNGESGSQACQVVPSFRLMCTPTGQALSPTGPLNNTPQCSSPLCCASAAQKHQTEAFTPKTHT